MARGGCFDPCILYTNEIAAFSITFIDILCAVHCLHRSIRTNKKIYIGKYGMVQLQRNNKQKYGIWLWLKVEWIDKILTTYSNCSFNQGRDVSEYSRERKEQSTRVRETGRRIGGRRGGGKMWSRKLSALQEPTLFVILVKESAIELNKFREFTFILIYLLRSCSLHPTYVF